MRSRPWFSCGIAASVLLLELLALIIEVRFPGLLPVEWSLGLAEPLLVLTGLVALLCVNDGEAPLLGMRLRPVQGWLYWFRIALRFGAAIVLLLIICSGAYFFAGWEVPLPPRPMHIPRKLFWMCLYAPLVEEVVYRSLLTAATYPWAGERGAIIASGVVFAAIHVIAGNPGPDNLLAGFLLEWAFLRSRTILVPMAMHSAGNLAALVLHLAVWL